MYKHHVCIITYLRVSLCRCHISCKYVSMPRYLLTKIHITRQTVKTTNCATANIFMIFLNYINVKIRIKYTLSSSHRRDNGLPSLDPEIFVSLSFNTGWPFED